MSLSDLPDDILGLISFWLNGFDNCLLWIASDHKLKERLLNNVIHEFNIVYRTPGRFLWPGNFLKKLKRISRLSLVVAQQIHHLPIENVELFPIDRLQYLKLDFSNCDKLFESKNAFSGLATSSNDSKYINIDSFYPNLVYFELASRGSLWDLNFTIDFVRFLPKNLKSFFVPQTRLRIDHSNPNHDLNVIISLLPRSLTELNLSVWSAKKMIFDASFLPRNLTNLTTNACIQEESFHMIPKNITKLDLCYTKYDIQKLLPFLSNRLRSLSFDSSSIIGDSLAHFDHLEYYETFYAPETVEFISKYPQNLKTFRGFFDHSPNLQIAPFPLGLVELCLDTQCGSYRPLFEMMPQTITKLSLFVRESRETFEFFKLLPNKLQILETHLPIIEDLSLLPESLKELHLNPLQAFEINEFDQLPTKLETLSLTQVHVPKSILKRLPTNLKLLHLESSSMVIDDEDIESLPRFLTNLTFKTEFKLTDASSAKYPPNLKLLALIGEDQMTDDAIVNLPRSLTYLHLVENTNLTDKCIKQLPRQLINLNLPKCKGITYNCCIDLPPYLSCIRLPNCADWKQNLPNFTQCYNGTNIR